MPAPMPDEPVLVGRAREKEQLADLIEATASGKRGAVIMGPAGAGKSTLLRWARQVGQSSGLAVASVRVPSRAGLPPRFPTAEVLERLASACIAAGLDVPDVANKILDTLRGGTSSVEYAASIPQVADCLEVISHRLPVAIFVDDIHLLPSRTLDFFLGSLRAADGRLLLLCSARIDPGVVSWKPPDPSADLWLDHIYIKNMDALDLASLVETVLGGPPVPSLVEELEQRTRGNPLFAVETLRAWTRDHRIERVAGHTALAGHADTYPLHTVRDYLDDRVSTLPPLPRRTLETLTVRGSETTVGILAQLLDLDQGELLRALDVLIESELVVDAGAEHPPSYRVAHPLVEWVVAESLPSTTKSHLHTTIYRVLKEHGGDAAELAHHGCRSLLPSTEISAVVREAATHAHIAGSAEDEAEWLTVLEKLSHDEDRTAIRLEHAQAVIQFDTQRARQLLDELLSAPLTSAQRLRALKGRANTYRVDGEFVNAVRDLVSALEVPGGVSDFHTHRDLAVLYALQGNTRQADAALAAATPLAQVPEEKAQLLGTMGSLNFFLRSDPRGAHDRWMEAFSLPSQPDYRAYLHHNLSWAKILLGDWDRAEQLLVEGVALAEGRGDLWNLNSLLASYGRITAWRGMIPEALDAARRASRLAAKLRNPVATVDAWDSLALALLESGNAAEALEVVDRALTVAADSPELREISFTFTLAAEASLRTGDYSRAMGYLMEAHAHLDAANFWAPLVARVDAEADVSRGRTQSALETASRALESSVVPFEEARLRLLLGNILLKSKSTHEARTNLQIAEGIFSRLGCDHYCRTAREALRMLEPKQKGRPRNRDASGLTPRERQVLHLVARGLTNREIAGSLFISPATVKTHVERLIAKLGVTRRADLMRLASDSSPSVDALNTPLGRRI